MGLTLDKFYSVDLAYQMYKELIKVWQDATPTVKHHNPVLLTYSPAVFARLILSSYSAQISRMNEKILDLEDTQKSTEYNKKISDYMDSVIAFARIFPKVPLSPAEIKQKIKNALAHAEYDLVYDGDVRIVIDTDFIKGEIPLIDMDELYRFYNSICDELEITEKCYTGLESFLDLSTNNVEVLKRSIDKIGIAPCLGNYVFDRNMNIPGNITIFGQYGGGHSVGMDDNSKKLLTDYIRYVGLSSWVNLSNVRRRMIFAKHFKFMIDGRHNLRNSPQNIQNTLDYLVFRGNGEISMEEMYCLSFEAPFIYTGMVLDLGFLCLNYIKEALAKEDLPDFNYRNIDLRGIKYSPSDCVKLVSMEEEKNKLSGPISDLEAKRNRLIKVINKNKMNLINLDKATSLTDELRKEKKENVQKNIDDTQKLLDEVDNRLSMLRDKYNNASDYHDTNEFFRHLRNSISHGFYTIDYSKAFAKKDLSKIVFKFQDWNIDENNRKNKTLCFEAEITAGKLLEIFEQLHSRLKKSYDTIDKSESKLLYYDDLRKRKDIGNDSVEEYLDNFKKKGFTLKKINFNQ